MWEDSWILSTKSPQYQVSQQARENAVSFYNDAEPWVFGLPGKGLDLLLAAAKAVVQSE